MVTVEFTLQEALDTFAQKMLNTFVLFNAKAHNNASARFRPAYESVINAKLSYSMIRLLIAATKRRRLNSIDATGVYTTLYYTSKFQNATKGATEATLRVTHNGNVLMGVYEDFKI